MKGLLRFLLLLCLLQGGNQSVLAGRQFVTSINVGKPTTPAAPLIQEQQNDLLKPAPNGSNGQAPVEIGPMETATNEKDEDEHREIEGNVPVKFLSQTYHVAILLSDHIHSFFNSYIKNCLSFSRHFSYPSTPAIVVFGILRI